MPGWAHCRPLPLPPTTQLRCQPPGRCSQEEVREMVPHYAPLPPPQGAASMMALTIPTSHSSTPQCTMPLTPSCTSVAVP